MRGDLPVLLISGNESAGTAECVREDPAATFLGKPFGMSQLRAALARVGRPA